MSDVQASIRYTLCDWGDLIEGSKEQLQSIGLGIGAAFPGEPMGPKRHLDVSDARGFPVKIGKGYLDGDFSAFLHFPGWPKSPSGYSDWVNISSGVKRREFWWFDEYVGTAMSLVAAGLVEAWQLPGQPGMRKQRVRVRANGTVVTGPPNSPNQPKDAGGKAIEKASSSTFRVEVKLPEVESSRRRRIAQDEEDEWVRLVRSMQRPAPLVAWAKHWSSEVRRVHIQPTQPVAPSARARTQVNHLRLVWSA